MPPGEHDNEEEPFRYASEADIQAKVLLMVQDALQCAGLGGLCNPFLEMTFFSNRPDIVVISRKALPKRIIMFIEVKSPCAKKSEFVFTNSDISYQVYSYLMVMKQLGHVDPIVCLCTFDKICMASLTDLRSSDSTEHDNFIRLIDEKVTKIDIEEILIEDYQNEKSDEFSPTRLLKKSVSAESDITRTLPYLLLLPQVQ